MDVINPILDDVEYVGFIFDAYGTNGKNFVYVDHVGAGIGGGLMMKRIQRINTNLVLMVWKMTILWMLKWNSIRM